MTGNVISEMRAGYVPTVDNFVVILDKSGSMGELYKGQKKLDYAKCIGQMLL